MSEVPLNAHAPGWLEQAEKGVGSSGKEVDACRSGKGLGSLGTVLGSQNWCSDGEPRRRLMENVDWAVTNRERERAREREREREEG